MCLWTLNCCDCKIPGFSISFFFSLFTFPSLPSRRIFGIRFKITSSTMPDDRSTYITLHQSTKLLYLASAYHGRLPDVCDSTADSYHSSTLDTITLPKLSSVHPIAINFICRNEINKKEKEKSGTLKKGLAYKKERKICFNYPKQLSVTMTTMSVHCGSIPVTECHRLAEVSLSQS